jgi:hypothetical protein
MKTEIVLLQHGYMEVASWEDYNGKHSQIIRTVDYQDVAGADAGDIEIMHKKLADKLNKYEKMQPRN